jgi:hypothetical protein
MAPIGGSARASKSVANRRTESSDPKSSSIAVTLEFPVSATIERTASSDFGWSRLAMITCHCGDSAAITRAQ